MTAYYNENDPFAAQWLRNLIDEGFIADGDVDDRERLGNTPPWFRLIINLDHCKLVNYWLY